MAQRRPAAKQSALKVARQALQVAQSLKASVEKKYAITIFEDSEVIRTGAVFFLNETQQGLGDAGERVGDVIRMTRIRFSLQFIQPVSLTGSHAMRMVIVLDKQNVLRTPVIFSSASVRSMLPCYSTPKITVCSTSYYTTASP
jgi:hypothetical protein